MHKLQNEIINIGSALVKLGMAEDCQASAGVFCELLDFVGDLKNNQTFKIENRHYIILGYESEHSALSNGLVSEEDFNKKLAEHIINLALNEKQEAFQLNFKRTEERMGMLRVLQSKNPKIIFGN